MKRGRSAMCRGGGKSVIGRVHNAVRRVGKGVRNTVNTIGKKVRNTFRSGSHKKKRRTTRKVKENPNAPPGPVGGYEPPAPPMNAPPTPLPPMGPPAPTSGPQF